MSDTSRTAYITSEKNCPAAFLPVLPNGNHVLGHCRDLARQLDTLDLIDDRVVQPVEFADRLKTGHVDAAVGPDVVIAVKAYDVAEHHVPIPYLLDLAQLAFDRRPGSLHAFRANELACETFESGLFEFVDF